MTICETCDGLGYTEETRTVMRDPWAKEGKPKTIKQGSGCPDCLGTGCKESDRERE